MINWEDIEICRVQVLNEIYTSYDLSDNKCNAHLPKDLFRDQPIILSNGDMLFLQHEILIKKYTTD